MKPHDASSISLLKSDEKLYQYINTKVLPELAKDRKTPFTLHVINEDTHPNYYVSEKCAAEHPEWEKLPKFLQTINCFDELVQSLIDRVIELGLMENTHIILYGDHQLYGDHRWLPEPRYLATIFPLIPGGANMKPIKWYDLPPTILELAGVEKYEPKFPFGASFFSNDTALRPTQDDISYLRRLVGG